MKKIILLSIFLLLIITYFCSSNFDAIKIPNSAIRVRVIANSNSIHDQNMKMKVKKYIEENLSTKLIDIEDITTARDIISGEINNLSLGIDNIFLDNNYNISYDINFGDNYFPKKEYRGISYDEGEYESLVVTIGSGEGDNWWCVLFPPLCLLEVDENDTDDVEYQFFVKEMIDKIFE